MADTAGGVVPALTSAEYERIKRFSYERFGLALGEGKEELVVSRLGPRLRSVGATSYNQYFDLVDRDSTGAMLTALIDSLTTNHTSFFREIAHFEHLKQHVLPNLPAKQEIWIWTAASSSGEEAYSIAMWLLEHGSPGTRYRILATDISTRVLQAAQAGIYPVNKLNDIPIEMQRKYLLRGEGRRDGYFRIRPEVRQMIQFERFNLVEAPFAQKRTFPLIFCRNVMIYFDSPTQENVVCNLAGCLWPGAYLYVGHSESLGRLRQPLDFVKPAIYRKGGAQ